MKEKEIQQSIPKWFIKPPKGSEKIMYARGTHISDTLQGAIDTATNRALRELAKKIEARINSKNDEMVRQAGMGENIATKTEINTISKTVVKEVTVSGWDIFDTKVASLDNGSYRSYVLLEYPLGQIYKAFIKR